MNDYILKDILSLDNKIKHGASEGSNCGKYPLFTSSNIINKYVDFFDYDGEYLIIGNGGSANIHYIDGKFAISTHSLVFRNKWPKVTLKFIYYFLRSNDILEKGFRGAGLKNISLSYINKIKIPSLSLEKQEQIVSQLEKLEKLKEKREQNIQRCDKLIKSIFYETFGDPIKNEKKWNTIELGGICDIKSGGTPSTSNKEYWETGDIPWIGSSYCKDKYIDKVTEFITRLGLNNSSTKLIPKNTAIIALVGATKGKTGYLCIDTTINQNVAAFLCDSKNINGKYLFYYLQTQYYKFTDVGQFKMINLQYLKKLSVILPAIIFQNEFVMKVEKIEKLKAKQIKSKEEIDNLFNGLMQKYFAGD